MRAFISLFYLKPSGFDVLSGEFTFQSGRKFLLHTDITERSQDRHRSLCQFSKSHQ